MLLSLMGHLFEINCTILFTNRCLNRKKKNTYLQLKISVLTLGKQNFKHLIPQLDFFRSKVYSIVRTKGAQLAS